MSTSTFFSVIIPTYNRGHLIEKAIESILGQSYENYEIIVIDNKSTDNTFQVLEKFINKDQIRYYCNSRNYERSYSRNRGFDESKGEFITLLDSDDILYIDCLKDANDHILKNKEVQFFHFKIEGVDDNYKPIYKVTYPDASNPIKGIMMGNYVSNNAVFYRQDVIKKIHYDETPIMIGIEDYDFVIRVLAETKHLDRIDKINGGVLLHPERSANLEIWDDTYKRVQYFINKQISSTEFNLVFGKYKDLFVSNMNLYLCGFLAVRQKTLGAFKFLIKSLRVYPSIFFTIKFWKHTFIIFKYAFNSKKLLIK